MHSLHRHKTMLGRAFSMLLFSAMLQWLGHSASAQGLSPKGEAFQNIEVLPDQMNDGLKGIALRFHLHFGAASASNTPSPYTVECVLQDESGYPVHAANGAVGYSDRAGHCRDSIAVPVLNPDPKFEGHTMFIPYVAMGLNAGPNHVKVQLRLWDQSRHQVITESDPQDLRFQKPLMQLYRMRVERIETYTTDADGETWDYKFLNARDIYPELIWSLRRGSHVVFESPKQKNDTIYEGVAADISPWIWLSQGDRIHYYVHDFDLLGFSDLVGSLVIDVWQAGFRSGMTSDLRFERVRDARVAQEAIMPPKVVVSGYEVVEGEMVEGVTGTRVKLDYAVDNPTANARYFIGLKLDSPLGSMTPNSIHVLGAGAVPVAGGAVELLAQRGSLDLFIPHFAFAATLPAHAKMCLEAGALIDAQPLVLTRLERQVIGGQQAIADMGFGQWKVGVEDQAGRGGLRISLDYEVPAGYLRDLERFPISLQPQFELPWGTIDNANLEALGSEAAIWKGDHLELDAAHAKGVLDLFLPFAKCPPGGGSLNVQASYTATMKDGNRNIAMGHLEKTGTLELPPLRQLHMGLREATVARRQWILSHPSMYWELRSGDKILLKSSVIPDQRTAHWADNAMHQWVVAPSDRVELRVYHHVTDGEADRLLEMWSGQLSELPDKEKGNVRLPTTSLKKMLVHLEYEDGGKGNGR